MKLKTQRSAAIAAIYGSLLWPDGWTSALREVQSIFSADHVFLTAAGQPTLSGAIGIASAELNTISKAVPASRDSL